MKEDLRGALWRFAIYAAVCLVAVALVFAIFGQFRFTSGNTYHAYFTNVSGLRDGNFVRIAGVEVGKVEKISIQPDMTVHVEFSVNRSAVLTEGTRAAIRYDDLIGGRYMSLEEGAGGVKRLAPGGAIPIGQTEPALDLDALIGGFRPLFRALNPDQVNALTGQLIAAFQGQGPTISSFLNQAAALTNTLGDRDKLIGQVIVNLNTVLGSLGGQSKQFAKAVDSLSELVAGLSQRKEDISNAVAYGNAAAGSIADLLVQGRKPLTKVVSETDRVAGIVDADHDYVDNLLNTLPDAYQMLGRLGIYGDFFTFYLCDLLIKVNGKGGQPVYVKLAGQDTGRCTPK
ncbi:virulence factor Mce family protein [Mycobacterium vicinigordonae]|uniref:Virulence factor Mce family protein n=1 Tax=Mycobacterium vicinigordonae TaxID=1719132 RepID=A0A7D6I0Y2_9MYCO|nr:virulence factor Mce family protein [Mycobacterium vicinigordonae]QLL09835.1 virulence factor Mce family protein [Mycobacterium vicinigordonae]